MAEDCPIIIQPLTSIVDKQKDYKLIEMGLKDLAYPINNKTKAWYFVINFSSDKPELLAEFRRLALINKSVIRHLIINLEKEYGYRATQNEKKIARSKVKLEHYQKKQKQILSERANREANEVDKKEINKIVEESIYE